MHQKRPAYEEFYGQTQSLALSSKQKRVLSKEGFDQIVFLEGHLSTEWNMNERGTLKADKLKSFKTHVTGINQSSRKKTVLNVMASVSTLLIT